MTDASGCPESRGRDDIDCEKALALLQDFLKQELTPETSEQVRDHLQRCKPCLCHSRYQERFLSLLRASAAGECCPQTVRSKVLAMLRREAPQGEPGRE